MNSIETINLSIGYRDLNVVDSLNIKIPKGKITVIIGPNGCGKSTLLKAIGRILRPRSGRVFLDGKDINTMDTAKIAKKMSILPQSPLAPIGLTVGELVSYGRFPHKNKIGKMAEEDKDAIEWALAETKLLDLETSPVDTLSGGQRQRAWIAMAIAQQTDTILLDEPTTYLDMSYQLEVLELLKKLNEERGYTIVMVLHDLNLAARHADFMVAVRNGRIISSGTPWDLMRPEILRETFCIEAGIVTDPNTDRPTCLSYNLIK